MNQRIYSILGGVPNINRSDQTFQHITRPNTSWQTRPHTYLRRKLPMLQTNSAMLYEHWGLCILIRRTPAQKRGLRFQVDDLYYSLDATIELVEYKLGLRSTPPEPFKLPPAIKHNQNPVICYARLSCAQARLLLYYYDRSLGRDVDPPQHNCVTRAALLNQGWIEMHDGYGLQITDWAREIVAQELTARAG